MSDAPSLPQQPDDPPPAYGCVVHIAKHVDGVVATVVNLDGIEPVVAPNERAALSQIVAVFRKRMAAAKASGETIELKPDPSEPRDGEIRRFLPIHL